jgi:carbon-monoxide dehydrogenase large subunit
MACVAFVRSPFAHARIKGIDVKAALDAPGVVDAFTCADIDVARFHAFMVLNPACARPALADGRVNFVGEAVVMTVAETEAQAVDAAELVMVDYDPLPAVADIGSGRR